MNSDIRHLSPMRAVVARTGVSAHLLRAWERRYEAVTPHRSPGGQRMYSEGEVERIRLLRDAVATGEAISVVARLPTEELRRITRTATGSSRGSEARNEPRDPEPTLKADLSQALSAVEDRNEVQLRDLLRAGSFRLTHLAFLEDFLVPLLTAIGDRWARGHLGPAEEHLASQVIRDVLGEMLRAARAGDAAPVIVCAAPAGQRHEFGALFSAVAASHSGWRALHLGPDLPMDEIARVAVSSQALAVALGILHVEDPARESQELERKIGALRAGLLPRVRLFVGGHPAARDAAARVSGTEPLAGLRALDRALRADAEQGEARP
jgi:MerR family transcriptional regulator, light-induced transcriptional regulator